MWETKAVSKGKRCGSYRTKVKIFLIANAALASDFCQSNLQDYGSVGDFHVTLCIGIWSFFH